MSFLKNLLGFESSFAKNITKDIWKDPTRLFTGIDPLSTKISNTLTGQDNEALVNMWGTPEQQYLERARAEGIDTSDAEQMQGYAEKVAGMFALNGLGNAAGNVMGGLGGGAAGASNVAPTLGGMSGGGAALAGGGAIGAGGAAAAGGGGLLSSLGGVQGLASIGGGLLTAYSANKQAKDQAAAVAAANERGTAPGYALPYINDALAKSQALANKPYEAYTGQLNAGTNPYEQAANQGITDWAKGTPQSTQANAAYQDMVANPNRFGQGAASLSASYADNHLGTLNQSQAKDMAATGASNGYIGAQTQGISGAPQVSGLLGNNAYLGQSSGSVSAGRNPMMGLDNKYLNDAIQYAQDDVTRNYDRVTAPQQAQRMAASGSFGNTGLMAQDSEERRNLAGELGRVSSGMRMQDYTAQQGLYENDVNRQLGADTFNVQSRAGDLGRNLAGGFQQMGMGQEAARFDASNALNTQQFNAGLSQTDLARNAQLQQQQGQYNATNQQGANQWNAGNQTQNNQFNTGAANSMSLANAGIQNNTNQFNVSNLMQAGQFNANAANNMNQFNANMAVNQQGQGLQGLLNMDGRALQGSQAMGLLGDRQRGLDQQGLNTAYEQWQRQQAYPGQQSQAYNAAVNGLTFGSTPQIPQQQVSPGLQGLGAASSIYGLLKPSNTTGQSAGPYNFQPTPGAVDNVLY